MGILVAKRYPTNLAIGLADHTYVECKSGGRRWRCFGGTSGGTALRSGNGSTKRADLIAEPNEQAGLKCYLVNGVCHQAANRILFPAAILVLGARGYKLSESLYGPYGRPRGLPCLSPFNPPPASGDLPACAVAGMRIEDEQEMDSDAAYIEGALEIYRHHGALEKGLDDHALVDLQVQLFMHLVQRQLGSRAKSPRASRLPAIRADEERDRIKIEDAFFTGSMRTPEFLKQVGELERRFQRDIAEALEVQDYVALLGTYPGDIITLVDPEIAQRFYGEGPPR